MATSTPARYGQALSERELQVLTLAAHGRSNTAIGAQMFISEHTVKTHMRRIYRKLGAADRTHAVALAARRGHIDLQAVRPTDKALAGMGRAS